MASDKNSADSAFNPCFKDGDSRRLIDDLTARVSHELRTPLASISAALGLLINDAGKTVPKPMMRLLTIAHNNSQKLVRLVNGILDMEKNDGARMGREVAAVVGDTRAMVGRTIADVERDLILETLKHCLGNRTHAAKILGISIRVLRNKLNEYTAEGVPVPPLSGGDDIDMAHQAQSAHARNSSRDARILQRGEKRHAVL